MDLKFRWNVSTVLFAVLLFSFPMITTLVGMEREFVNNVFTNLYVLVFFLSAIFLLVLLKIKMPPWLLKYGMILILLLIIRVLFSVLDNVIPYRDIYMFFRAWFFLLILLFVLSQIFKESDRVNFVSKLFLFYWFFISCSIILAATLDVGLKTYPRFDAGYKFWFPATNELSFVYFSVFSFLYLNTHSQIKKVLLLGVTIFTFLLIGTKIFVVLTPVLLFYQVVIGVKSRYGFHPYMLVCSTIILLIAVSAYWIIEILQLLSEMLSYFSHGAATLDKKIQSVGLFSAMFGERDFLILLAVEYMKDNLTFIEYIFGKGLHTFMAEYSVYRGVGEPSLSENDFVDIFASYGLIGISLIILFIFKAFNLKKIFNRDCVSNLNSAIMFQGILVVLSASLSGHILMFTFPLIIMGLVISLRLK